ncbi:MAG TPA: ATP-binding protein [Dehalococcoidia bacterium]|jgi:predicted kinase|nr:ATP-binding protein [Dehalococcoidia bacterium]
MAIVVQMHGEPGSGKSTLASALGARLGAVVLDKDIVKAAVMRAASLDNAAAGPPAYEVYWAIARSIAMQGHSLIFDNPAYWPRVQQQSRAIADEAGASYVMIECVCPDRGVLIDRLVTRDAMISQPREPYRFDAVDGITEPACERLVLDTTRPFDEIVEEALAYTRAVPV